ncbi:hypothetical protein [Brevundimonas olei]|uniref:hypothetical protein n=1 Tax=Brevundimonas olei TaxID=657642 RepID=UPI0031D09C2E
MCDNILELIAVIFGAAEISAAIVIASMFLGCFQQFKFPQLTIDQIIALTASVGSLAAAVATYLTVREMKAGRVLGARARLTTPGTDQQIAFAWARAPKNYVQSPSKVRIIIRNASQGVAHKIRLNWRLENPIDAAGLKDI